LALLVSIRTAIIGCSFGGGDYTVAVEVPEGRATLRALIQGKVAREVAAFNRNRHLLYGREYRAPEELVADEQAAADPARHGALPEAAWEQEAQRAVEAFGEGAFRVTVDERTVRALDDEIELSPQSDVVFLRLMPFVSG
jgi:hypothetical protein